MAQPPNDRHNSAPRIRDNEWIVGRLLEHGSAKYQFEEDNSLSYFMRLRTEETAEAARRRIEDQERAGPGTDGQNRPRRPTHADGGVRTLWGADLKRAIEHSKSHVKVGQIVAARLIGREPLYAIGKPTPGPSKQEIPNYRNRWEVETPQFIVERAKTARQILDNPIEARREGKSHPELAGTYLALRGAEIIAKHRYPHPDDQRKFVDRVRAALTLSAEPSAPAAPPEQASHTSEPPARE
jgi:hypothetical protein